MARQSSKRILRKRRLELTPTPRQIIVSWTILAVFVSVCVCVGSLSCLQQLVWSGNCSFSALSNLLGWYYNPEPALCSACCC